MQESDAGFYGTICHSVIDAPPPSMNDFSTLFTSFRNTSFCIHHFHSWLLTLSMHPSWQVFYVVSKESQGWRGGKGHVSKDMIIKGLPSPSDDTLIMVTRVLKLPATDKLEMLFAGYVCL